MRAVLDTNILFSFFSSATATHHLITRQIFDMMTPRKAEEELLKYKDTICKRHQLSHDQFHKKLAQLKEVVAFVDINISSSFFKQAEAIAPDPGDAEFFTACLENKAFLWSNDAALKNQNKVLVLSTKDIITTLI